MGSTGPSNAILPVNLGPASAFDQNVFPLAYYVQKGNLNKGSYLIRATLEEMERIKQLGIDLNENQDFIFDTRLNLEALKMEKAKLQDNHKTLNPFKAFLNYRAARLFHVASRALYLQTKRTSEEIHRGVQVVPNTQMQMMDDAVSPDAAIVGFSIELPDGLNDDAKRTIRDITEMIAEAGPFDDNPLISQLRDGEQAMSLLSQVACSTIVDEGSQTSAASTGLQQSHPTSPQTITVVNYIQNSIVTTSSSNLSGVTQNRGDRNSGASVTSGFAP